jgi:cell division protein FtsW
MADENKVVNLKKRKKHMPTKLKSGDFWLTALVFTLVVFGVVMVFSASYYYAISKYDSPYYFLIRDSVWALFGTIGLFTMGAIDYHKLKYLTIPVLLISIGMLIILLFPQLPFVQSLNGSARWIKLGPITLMPGEIAKVAVILFASAWLAKKPGIIRKFKEGILPMIILMIVVCGLIAVNNAITAATVAVIIMGIMFIAGLHLGFFGGIAGLGAAGFALLIITDTKGYRLQRVTSFLDPFADAQNTGFQVVQGLLALGSGGLFGVGLGKSMQKTLYLPEPQNDFIYAIIGEELGFIGLLVLLAVYLLLIWRCVHISMNAPDTFGMLLGSGITIMLAVQVILNVMVVTSLMPPTGIILPFVSWGGNALLIFMGCMGIMLNISRHIPK